MADSGGIQQMATMDISSLRSTLEQLFNEADVDQTGQLQVRRQGGLKRLCEDVWGGSNKRRRSPFPVCKPHALQPRLSPFPILQSTRPQEEDVMGVLQMLGSQEGLGMSETHARAMFTAVDADENGSVDWVELVTFICDAIEHLERESYIESISGGN
jgi:hypothetical protein